MRHNIVTRRRFLTASAESPPVSRGRGPAAPTAPLTVAWAITARFRHSSTAAVRESLVDGDGLGPRPECQSDWNSQRCGWMPRLFTQAETAGGRDSEHDLPRVGGRQYGLFKVEGHSPRSTWRRPLASCAAEPYPAALVVEG